jgi:hypothetical protein
MLANRVLPEKEVPTHIIFFFKNIFFFLFLDISKLHSDKIYYCKLDSEPTNLWSFSLMLHTKQRSNKYQFHSLWFDPTGTQPHDLPHSKLSTLTTTPPMRFARGPIMLLRRPWYDVTTELVISLCFI